MPNEEPKPDLCASCGTPLGTEITCPTCGRTKDVPAEAVEQQRETRHGQDPQGDLDPQEPAPS